MGVLSLCILTALMWDTGICSRQTVGVDPPDTFRCFAFPIMDYCAGKKTYMSVTHEERERHANAHVRPLEKKSQGGGHMKDNESMKINWLC